ncbi:MAG TPA: CPXCG motif-containing cysteine-rich protein [Lacunisphaera sp.]|jgi:hypothetical protein|nr:CPXCG motif-containing cysteine-rich protein [Lacunisphaera sp.]
MQDAVTIGCPHCGEEFPLTLDLSEGDAEFVVDCEVCCRPMTIRLKVDDGQVAMLEAEAE